MSKQSKTDDGAEVGTQNAIDALDTIDFESLSFIQLRRLNAALIDSSERVAAETARRANEETLGDTVRVPVPPSRDR